MWKWVGIDDEKLAGPMYFRHDEIVGVLVEENRSHYFVKIMLKSGESFFSSNLPGGAATEAANSIAELLMNGECGVVRIDYYGSVNVEKTGT